MLMYKNNGKMSFKFCIIIESNSQKAFFVIALYTNMAAMTSRENREYSKVSKSLILYIYFNSADTSHIEAYFVNNIEWEQEGIIARETNLRK